MNILFIFLWANTWAQEFEIRKPGIEFREQLSAFWPLLNGVPSLSSRSDLSLEFSLGDPTWSVKATPWIWVWAPPFQGGATGIAKVRLDLKEAWLEFAKPDVDLRVGHQVMGWGAADKINPTDVWNPVDLTDPLLSEKLAMPSVLVRIHPTRWENTQIEFVGTAFFRSSELPVAFPTEGLISFAPESSRWLLALPTSFASSPLYYELASPSYPLTWQGAVRLRLLRLLEGWDFSLMYFSGVEKEPRIGISQHGTAGNPVLPLTNTLNPSFHRMEVFGLDAAGSLTLGEAEFGIRAEAALTIPDNSRVASAPVTYQADLTKDRFIQAVLGIDHTFKKNILGTVLYWNLQAVIQQRIDNLEIPTGSLVMSGFPNFVAWDRNLVLYLEDRMGSNWKFTVTSILGLKYGDIMIQPTLHHALSDSVKAQLGVQVFGGSRAGFFGQNFESHRVLTQISATF